MKLSGYHYKRHIKERKKGFKEDFLCFYNSVVSLGLPLVEKASPYYLSKDILMIILCIAHIEHQN
jgi:hypothetical protein